MKKISQFILTAFVLSACSQIPEQEYSQRGSPFTLLDASTEMVNVALVSQDSVSEVVQWIDQDQPTQADLYCLEEDAICLQVLDTLQSFRVPVNYVSAADNMLTLVYERVVTRDCDNRYVDNPINPYNLNYRSFGCSTAVNMVQMIGDKRQLTSPALLDLHDGQRATQTYQLYIAPYDLQNGSRLSEGSLISNQ